MSTTQLTEEDEGKRVMTTDGDKVGMVTEVRGGTAYVDADPGMFDSIKSKLGWGDTDEDTYPLSSDDVGEVTDDEVRLR
jgi:hypothetical protein